MVAQKKLPVVLVIDDNLNNITVVVDFLHQNGFETITARNGEMGLKRASFVLPDLILLDVQMPGIDGFETCQRLKANPATNAIPVIFMTVAADAEYTVRGFAAGGVDYLSKPVQLEELLARVRAHITIQAMQRQVEAQYQQLQRELIKQQHTEQALRRSEERFRLLAENARHIVFRFQLKPVRHFEYVSPAIESITGYHPTELYHDPDLHFKAVHPESYPLLLYLQRTQQTLKDPLLLRYRRKDGQEIWLEQDHWIVGEDGDETLIMEGILRDVTDRKRTEEQLLQHERAAAMLREREYLARELHDGLGQTLSFVNTQAQVIFDYFARNDLDQARIALSSLLTTVRKSHGDVREFIAGVSQSIAQDRAFFAALEDYIALFARTSGIETLLNISPRIYHATFAPTIESHLWRIIQEALTNVRKHAEATLVQVTFALEEEILQVSIEDNGKGLEHPDDTATEGEHQTSTSGFGLHSMHGRASEIGGTLTVQQAAGHGTVVTVHIPMRRQGDITTHGMRVLLVDDNPLFQHGIHSLLHNRGFRVVGTATNGREALERVRDVQPDVVLMDVQMPEMNGLEATRRIKADFPDIQIVMLTFSDDEATLFEAIKSGATGYLLKSLAANELCTALLGLSHGEAPLSPRLAMRVLQEFSAQEEREEHPPAQEEREDKMNTLTETQQDVLQHVANGYTYREVGDMLGFSEITIKRYMGAIVRKLHVKDRADAIAYVRPDLASDNTP